VAAVRIASSVAICEETSGADPVRSGGWIRGRSSQRSSAGSSTMRPCSASRFPSAARPSTPPRVQRRHPSGRRKHARPSLGDSGGCRRARIRAARATNHSPSSWEIAVRASPISRIRAVAKRGLFRLPRASRFWTKAVADHRPVGSPDLPAIRRRLTGSASIVEAQARFQLRDSSPTGLRARGDLAPASGGE
jgi:hypothetical protein